MKSFCKVLQLVLLTVMFVVFGLVTAFAQIEVKGTVVDANKDPVPAITGQVKGSSKAICTSSSATLLFSYVGFNSRNLKLEKNQR